MKNINKIIGWVFVSLGIVIILWTLNSSYAVFTGKSNPPEIFKMQEKQITALPDISDTLLIEQQMQEEMGRIIQEQLMEVIPSDVLSITLNLMAWSILAGIFIFGGSKIAGIGISLLKKE